MREVAQAWHGEELHHELSGAAITDEARAQAAKLLEAA